MGLDVSHDTWTGAYRALAYGRLPCAAHYLAMRTRNDEKLARRILASPHHYPPDFRRKARAYLKALDLSRQQETER